MNLNNRRLFHPILKMKWNFNCNQQKNINKYIPREWQFIIMNSGSLTQNLHSLLNHQIHIEMSQRYNEIINHNKFTNIRIVWLENYINQNLTFAKSIWVIDKKENQYKKILTNYPIGYSLINLQAEIYKNLEEIYCGYSYNLENFFDKPQLIWGRKYKIYYSNNSYITIEEYFTPQLINAFYLIS